MVFSARHQLVILDLMMLSVIEICYLVYVFWFMIFIIVNSSKLTKDTSVKVESNIRLFARNIWCDVLSDFLFLPLLKIVIMKTFSHIEHIFKRALHHRNTLNLFSSKKLVFYWVNRRNSIEWKRVNLFGLQSS